MPTDPFAGVFRHLRAAALRSDGAGMTDGQLLECYLAHREEAAFEALVRRYGPMVLGVCRRILRNEQDAEDAFQATFVVLLHKGSSIQPPDRVGNWLYGVAYRTSLKAKGMNAKRRLKEKQVAAVARPEATLIWRELEPFLDRELSRLPEKYRLPIVLCDLESRTRREAARQLGWPEGTVATRLATARRILAKQLARHAPALCPGSLGIALRQKAPSASVPSSLVSSTVKAAKVFAAGRAAAGNMVSARVAVLARAVLKGMFMNKVKIGMAMLLVLSTIGLGISAGTYQLMAGEEGGASKPDRKQPVDARNRETTNEEPANGRLPTGPAPVQPLVSLVDKERLAVRTAQLRRVEIVDKTSRPPGIRSSSQREVLSTELFELTEIEVLNNKGTWVSKAELPKLLQGEKLALVFWGQEKLDPLHLRVVKDDMLIFVLPYSDANPPLVPAVIAFPRQPRAGNIIIVGNEKTPDDVILKALAVYPGQVISFADLRKAERTLAGLNLFEVNRESGVHPTVMLGLTEEGVSTKGSFFDIIITVKEKSEAPNK